MHGQRRCAGPRPALAAALRSTALAALLLACWAPAAGAAAPATLYVAPHGSATGADHACASARYSNLQPAILAAAAHATIIVCPGTYAGGVVVSKPVLVRGEHATIQATGADVGITVPVSGVTVQGFTVTGATGEGILVVGRPHAPVADVRILDNVVRGNDRGNPSGAPLKTSKYRECNAAGPVPGDCGEGIHLMVAVHSLVAGNTVEDNSGGILLTDEFGPNAHNTIEDNLVTANTLDCGITLASHSTLAFVQGKPAPAAGGVYANTVAHNTVLGNGIKGQGAGILLATGVPGGAVYGNLVADNTIRGNGLAGVTLHSHTPNEDLNGNVIRGNTIGVNNLDGDYDFKPHLDKVPTGIIVASAVSAIAVTVDHNTISGDADAIWHTGPVTIAGLASNRFVHVGTAAAAG